MKINMETIGNNLLAYWLGVPEEDQLKGLSANLIAKSINTDVEVLDILMPQYKFKKVRLFGEMYWVHVRSYAKFRENIEVLLLS
ncbi:MAG: hypothetical protein PHH91_08880 [Desulfuromonadaceae bacterium]|nr:hypothetical protein [Desulfuromonadaceae bacterium]